MALSRQLWMAMALLAGVVYAFSPASASRGTQDRRPAAADFRLPTLDGGSWSLKDQRGKVVVVNFWATWCPPCRIDTPTLVRIHERFSNRNVAVVGITLDEDPRSTVPPFASRFKLTYPVLLPGAGSNPADSISGVPTTWLIDARGRLAKTYSGVVTESSLTADVEQLLAER